MADANRSSSYPLIVELESADTRYRDLIAQYTSLYGQYIDDQAAGDTAAMAQKSQMLSQLVTSLGAELDDMNRIMNAAYNDGVTNQTLSAEASNALATQSTLIDMRMKQYQEARDALARVVGEEASSHMGATRSRLIYYVYFIFALSLCAGIVYMVLGGSLPFGLLVVLLVLGLFIGWEFYKSWLARLGSGISLNAPAIKGVFRIVT